MFFLGIYDIKMRKENTMRFAFLMGCLCLLGNLRGEQADLIFLGGDILTVNDQNQTAEAVGVREGKIVYVGDKAGALALKGEKTEVVDLQGKTLMPGFIDSHTHIILRALILATTDVSPFKYKTIGEVLNVLREAAKKGPVMAVGYDPSLMTEPGELDFKMLDQISRQVPVVVVNKSGHIVYGNHKAFELAKVTDNTPDPMGGSFQRDALGKLTGVGYEIPALGLLASVVNPIPADQMGFWIQKALKMYAKWGYTTVTDLALGLPMPTPLENVQILRKIAHQEAPVRVQGYMVFNLVDQIPAQQKQNDDKFRVLGMKIWADGSIQGYTAAMKERYKDQDTKGKLNFTQDALTEMVLNARKNHLQVAIHANGDQAIEDTLRAFETASQEYPSDDPRFRIEHATIVDPAQWKRIAQVKATPSFTEHHVYYWGEVFKDKILGEPRADWMDAAQTAKELGIKFSFNDDDLAGANPLFFIQVAATREMQDGKTLNPSQKITIDDAIKAMTLYPAWQTFREKELGSIEVGKFADLTLLEHNPKKVDVNKIKDIKIVGTWLNGKKVE